MALRPPRTGLSVARRLSERARAASGPQDATAATGTGHLGGMVDALHSLVDQLSAAVQDRAGATPDAETGGTARSTTVHGVDLGGKAARMVFGYTLRMGLDGVSAEPFGDVPDKEKPASAGPNATASARQPIVDVFEEPGIVVVVAELPGADPAGLVCRPDGRTLLIETAGARRYRKQVALPAPVSADGMVHSFQNGILEVRLKRADAG